MLRPFFLCILALTATGCVAFPVRTPQPLSTGPLMGGTLDLGQAEMNVGGGTGVSYDAVADEFNTSSGDIPGLELLANVDGGLEIGLGRGVSLIPFQAGARFASSFGAVSWASRTAVRWRMRTHRYDAAADVAERSPTVVLGAGATLGSGGWLANWGTYGFDFEAAVVGAPTRVQPRAALRIALSAPMEHVWGSFSSGPWIYAMPAGGVAIQPLEKRNAFFDLEVSGWVGTAIKNPEWWSVGIQISSHLVGRPPKPRAPRRSVPADLI